MNPLQIDRPHSHVQDHSQNAQNAQKSKTTTHFAYLWIFVAQQLISLLLEYKSVRFTTPQNTIYKFILIRYLNFVLPQQSNVYGLIKIKQHTYEHTPHKFRVAIKSRLNARAMRYCWRKCHCDVQVNFSSYIVLWWHGQTLEWANHDVVESKSRKKKLSLRTKGYK